jgi:hypothetical protein
VPVDNGCGRCLWRRVAAGLFGQLGSLLDGLLERAGVPADEVAEARRVLIVHTIGAAAFATAPAADGDPDPPIRSFRESFRRSLTWLLAGIVHGRGEEVTLDVDR